MKYGIFADIHSNLEAFEAVLNALSEENIDKYVCVGDIVGYGANPTECIEKLRKLSQVTVCGNHDWASVGLADISYFNPIAKKAVIWTQGVLSQEDRYFLSSLKLVYRGDDLTIVHGTLDKPEEFDYILNGQDAKESFAFLETHVCFVGHSHVPAVFLSNGDHIDCLFETRIEILPEKLYIINVGSVGQPRDGNSKAAYAVYDTDNKIVEIKRVDYDIKKAQDKILEAGLPRDLAIRLAEGR